MQYMYQICLTFENFDIEPSKITQEIGIKPDFTQSKGEEIVSEKGIRRIARRSLWMLYSRAANKDDDITYHVENLKEQIIGKEANIKKICSKYDTDLTVIINDDDGDFRSVVLDKWLISFAADCGLDIVIDYYR